MGSFQFVRLDHLDSSLKRYRRLRGFAPPDGGWLRAIRVALGLSISQLASRSGRTAGQLSRAERVEANGRISLRQLSEIAADLDCELSYVLIPKSSLRETIETQAERIARDEAMSVYHSMSLDNKTVSKTFLKRQIAEAKSELLLGNWRWLWT